MLIWFAETTLIATVLAGAAALAGRCFRLGPVARHAFWLVVLVKLVTPPIVSWPRPQRAVAAVANVEEATKAAPSLAQMVRERLVRTMLERTNVPARAVPSPTGPAAFNLGRGIVIAWAMASVALGLVQAGRIVRFRRRVRRAVPAPSWLEDEARDVGARLGVKVPEVLVVPGSMTPLLWCLGRPKLLLPDALVKTLGAEGWRGILAHELAHLKRRDHWVRRIELVAGLVWWWNPVFWLTRGRLDAEAELACDECAVRLFPEGQLAYAEALLEVCRSISPPRPPVPALGIVGAGQFRFLERRVAMILRDPSPSRPKAPVLLSAGLLALLALPAWSSSVTPAPFGTSAVASASTPAVDDDEEGEAKVKAKAGKDKKAAQLRKLEKLKKKIAEKEAAAAKAEKPEAEKPEVETTTTKEETVEVEVNLGDKMEKVNELAAKLSEKLGPGSEFEKAMQKLGPELEKSMKGIAGELEASLGPDSEFAKQMKEAFGPDSDFAKGLMEAFGPESDFMKELTEAFGPDGEFAKEMKDAFGPDGELARELKAAFGPDGEVARELKAAGEEMKAAAEEAKKEAEEAKKEAEAAGEAAKSEKASASKEAKAAKAEAKEAKARARAELKAQIEALSKKLEELEGDEDESEEN